MFSYKFKIKIKENGMLGEGWESIDYVLADSINEAIINLDIQNNKLGYKVTQAQLIYERSTEQ